MVNNDVGKMPKRAPKIAAGDSEGDIGPQSPEDVPIGRAYPHHDDSDRSQCLFAFMHVHRLKAPHTFHPTVVGTCEGWHGRTYWGNRTSRPDRILVLESHTLPKSAVEYARGYVMKPGTKI